MTTWEPIATAPERQKVLVTNNIHARDAYGRMSHVWLVTSVQTSGDGSRVAFTDGLTKLHGITHWHPLPLVNDPDQRA